MFQVGDRVIDRRRGDRGTVRAVRSETETQQVYTSAGVYNIFRGDINFYEVEWDNPDKNGFYVELVDSQLTPLNVLDRIAEAADEQD